MKKTLKTVSFYALAILVGVTAVYATSKLTPPGSVTNTMYSLTDIYNLSAGTTTTEGSGTIETTPGTIAETGKTLTEVYTAISGEIAKLTNGKIAKDISAFGFTGTLYGDTDPTKVLTTATYPGTAVAGASAPTFASADVTSYDCSWFTDMTDPDDVRETPVTSEQICGYNTGCSWVDSACTGGVQTGKTYITWYAGVEACANSTEDGQTAGTWRLPTYPELVNHYLDNNVAGAPPTGFASDYYWSSTTYQNPTHSGYAYSVYMNGGSADSGDKDDESYLVRCAH